MAFFISYLTLPFFRPKHRLLFLLIACIGGIIPDIDYRKSWAARKIWPLNWILSFVLKHRGFIHTIYPPVIVGAMIVYLGGTKIYAIAFMLGYIVHLMLDMLTHSGIRILHPISSIRLRGFVKTGGIIDTSIFIASSVCAIFLLFGIV